MKSKTARPSKIVPRPGDEPPTGKRESPVYRSTAWLDAVRSIGFCVNCGAPFPQAAHRNEGKAKGRKVDDCLTAALCQTCHFEIDQGRELTKDQRRALMDRAIVLTMRELVFRGLVVLREDWRKL